MFTTTSTPRAVHKADGGWFMADETRTPLSRSYRDINQLLASDKIGCSEGERFSETQMRLLVSWWVWGSSRFLRILHKWESPVSIDDDTNAELAPLIRVKNPLLSRETARNMHRDRCRRALFGLRRPISSICLSVIAILVSCRDNYLRFRTIMLQQLSHEFASGICEFSSARVISPINISA
jgi:hypothetical protein